MRSFPALGFCLCLLLAMPLLEQGMLARDMFIQDKAAQEKPDAAAIRSLELKWAESYKQRKVDILASLLADDFVITVEDGMTYSKTGYISHSAEPSTKVEVAEISDVKVRLHGNTAVVTGAYYERGATDWQALRVPRPVHRHMDEKRQQVAGRGLALQHSGEVTAPYRGNRILGTGFWGKGVLQSSDRTTQ